MTNCQNGIGFHSIWGFSPSINLLQYFAQDEVTGAGSRNPIRILLLHPSDPRHIMKSIANNIRNNERPIHFYLMVASPELLARHLILLHVFFDCKVSIRHRAIKFLEIFGNTLLSKRSGDYFLNCTSYLDKLLSDEVTSGAMKSMVELTFLKQSVRDELSKIFRSWSSSESFDIVTLRDHRMRSYYGNRYDCRENVIDWEYQIGVKPVASIIHSSEFLHWRMTGVAFQFGDGKYSFPNKSTETSIKGISKKSGTTKLVKGYWADILIGPFISFGIACDQVDEPTQKLFQVINKGSGAEQHRHNATDISLYNVISLMWELQTRQKYTIIEDHDIFSGFGGHGTEDGDPRECHEIEIDAKVIPVVGDDLDSFCKKKKFHNYFDHISFSLDMIENLESECWPYLLRKRGTVTVEGTRYINPLLSHVHYGNLNDVYNLEARGFILITSTERNTAPNSDVCWYRQDT